MLQRFLLALWISSSAVGQQLRLGVERFLELYPDSLRGKRLAVVTHAAARLPDGRLSLERLREVFHVVAVWAPEHGFWGSIPAGTPVPDDTVLGIPVRSLYGGVRRPPPAFFRGVDAVVVELQDIGIRPYTYLSTLVLVMDACAEHGIPVYVLDRPNPLGGTVVEGAVLDTALRSFVGMLPIPYRHGCTLGELASLLNAEGWLPTGRRCSLTVVPMQGWRRTMVWEDTGLPWFPPSPNIPSPTAARAALITGVLGELGLWSIGIGTAVPFQLLGSPDFPAESLAEHVRPALALLGVSVSVTRFVPQSGQYAGRLCRGLFFVPAPRHDGRFMSAFGVLAAAIQRAFPDFCRALSPRTRAMVNRIVGQAGFTDALCRGEPLEPWITMGVAGFRALRQRYLLYP